MRSAAVLRITTCCLLGLASCRGPLYLPARVTVAPPAANGLPALAASSAGGASAVANGEQYERVARDGMGDEIRSGAVGHAAYERNDSAARESAGRLHLQVDPLFACMAQQAQAPDPSQQRPQEPLDSRWSDFLPLGRAAVLAAGYELPRAFGFGVAYTRLQRDIEVDEVRVGIDGGPPRPVGFLSVEADSTVDNVMGRLDAWVFPFWNVSVLGGWTWNESDSVVTVSVPFPTNPRDVIFQVPTRQDGPTLGVGTNLAAGYGEWFISGDGTWILADMQNFAVIEGFLGSIRSGWNGKVDGKPVRLWGGATYWDTATTIEGDVVTADGTVHFAVEQGPVTPYSLQIGGSLDFDRAYGIVLEGHLLRDVRMLVASVALRF